MIKLPDGREVAITSGAQLAQAITAGDDNTRYKVQAVVELFTSVSAKDVRANVIRGRDKKAGEAVAPFVGDLMRCGMSLATARNRHSDVKAMFYGWTHGKDQEIGNANGWQTSADIGRKQKALDDAEAAKVTARLGVLAIRDQKEQEAEAAGEEYDANAIREEAAEEYAQAQATKKSDAEFKALQKKATDAGYMLVSSCPTQAEAVQVAALSEFGIWDVRDALVVECERLENIMAAEAAAKLAKANANPVAVQPIVEAVQA